MGVQGLWQLLEPLGRPVTLESLENRVLAVDASIWLHQAVHGFRDKSGNPLPNSHLIGIFHRLCKLLSYRIKPVFVFDGTVPLLKRETMAARREKQRDAVQEAEKSRKQILTRHMKLRALDEVMKSKDGATSSIISKRSGDESAPKVDLYDLPPLPRPSSPSSPDSSLQLLVSSDEDETNDVLASFGESLPNRYQDLDNVDVESDDFKVLPLEIQHEILIELKEKLKRKSWTRLAAMPDDLEEIGKHQIQQLLIRRKVQKKLDEVSKMMGTFLSEATMDDTNELALERQAVEVRRIVSEDSAHYVLFKTSSRKYDDDAKVSEVGNSKPTTLIDKSSFEIEFVQVKTRKTDSKTIEARDLPVDKYVDGVSIAPSEIVSIKNADCKSVVSSSDSNEEFKGGETVNNIVINLDNNEIEGTNIRSDNNVKLIDDKPNEIDFERENIGFINEKMKFIDKNETDGKSKVNEMKHIEITSLSTITKEVKISNSDEKVEFIDTDNDLINSKMKLIDKETHIHWKMTEMKQIKTSPLSTATNVVKISNLDDNVEIINTDDEYDNNSLKPEAKVTEKTDVVLSVLISDDESDDDFVEVDSVQIISQSSPVNDELFPLEVFKVSETETDELVTSNIPETIYDLDKSLDNFTDETPFVESAASMDNEELKLLSEQLEQEVDTLVQEKGRQERVAATITAQMYVEIQELLKLFGVPYIVSPAEAEAQCATLDVLELTDGTITDDSDIWLFGGRRVYKNFFNHDKDVFFFKDADIKKRLGLDRRKLIAVALLTGSDYTEGIKGIGTVSALEVLAEFGGEDDGIDALKRFRTWWDGTQNKKIASSETKIKKTLRSVNLHGGFPSSVVVNAYLEPNVDSSKEIFTWAHPDLDELRHFAGIKLGWSKDKLDGLLLPVIKRLNSKESQRHMSDYFQTIAKDLPTTSKGHSRRLQRAIKRVRGSSDDILLDPKAKAVKVLRSKKVAVRGRGKCQTRPTNARHSNDDSEMNLKLSESSSSSGEEYIP